MGSQGLLDEKDTQYKDTRRKLSCEDSAVGGLRGGRGGINKGLCLGGKEEVGVKKWGRGSPAERPTGVPRS